VLARRRTDQRQRVASPRARVGQRSRPHLHDRKAAPGADDTAGRHVRGCFQDYPCARDDEDVDRETHEERVDHVARGNDESVTFRKPVAPEQTALSRGRIEGWFEHRGHNQPGSLVAQREWRRAASGQRAQKVRFQGLSDRMMAIRIRYLTG
jgi:hypothetical protein